LHYLQFTYRALRSQEEKREEPWAFIKKKESDGSATALAVIGFLLSMIGLLMFLFAMLAGSWFTGYALLMLLCGLLGAILGTIAKIKLSEGAVGSGMATAAIVIGWIIVALSAVFFVVF
jgi:hypothetical protein